MSELVSNPDETPTTTATDADALTAQVLGDTAAHDDVPATATEEATGPVDDFPCCTGAEHAPDPTADLTPADVFLAIVHRAGLTAQLNPEWEGLFPQWWDHTGANMGILRTAVDTAAYTAATGVTIPSLTTYLSALILDITAWTNADTTTDEAWTIHGFEARALADILHQHEQSIDPGAYTHPLHQLVHLATQTVGPDLTTVYGELCRTGAMGTPHTPYHLHHLHNIHEGATI